MSGHATMDTSKISSGSGDKWFMDTVVDGWNKINRYVGEANTIEGFKKRIDK